uniref:Uncharacterized protein n=1 Tax=Chenopodium quinoa TaxID=63459 RepID=A0A803M7B4_CHEQI
ALGFCHLNWKGQLFLVAFVAVTAGDSGASREFGLALAGVFCVAVVLARSGLDDEVWKKDAFVWVMARRLNKVFVPFQPLLEKVVAWLHFPSPVYGFIDADKNNVFVRVNRPNSRARFIFYGGDASSVEESRERAAHKAVKRLICRFSVWVSDFTYERIKMYPFLGVLVRKTGVTVTAIETTKLEGHGYMSWLMVTCPPNNIPMECIFSDPCPETTIAEQRVAKKACFFIASVFNLEIVDANYGAAVKISEECFLVREVFAFERSY